MTLPSATLSTNPITTIKDSKKILVRHTNHGMYNPSKNNVTISGTLGTLDGYNLTQYQWNIYFSGRGWD